MAETAQQKVDKDLKNLPKSVPTPKPLNYVGNPDAEVQATRFGNLELRQALDSRMQKNPVIQLGYDIIERGLLDPTAGEMGGEIRALFNPPGATRDNLYGLALASDALNMRGTGDTDSIKKTFEKSGTGFTESIGTVPRDLEVMGSGVASLLSPSRGSTVMYEADQRRKEIKKEGDKEYIVEEPDTIEDEYNLNVLAEELAHIGVNELARRGIDVGRLSSEEDAMRVMRAEMVESRGLTPSSARQYFIIKDGGRPSSVSLLERYNAAARDVLDDRGVPRRAVAKEPGMVDSMLNFFGLK